MIRLGSTRSWLKWLAIGGTAVGTMGTIVLLRHLRHQAGHRNRQQELRYSPGALTSAPALPIICVGPATDEEQSTPPALRCTDALLAACHSEAALAQAQDCAECTSDSSSDSDDEAPSPSGRQQVLAIFLSCHGLDRCVFVKVLGQGGFGRADLVTIKLPGGGAVEAVRKILFRRTDGTSRTTALHREIAGMRAAKGSSSAVQLLGHTQPKNDDDRHELLMTYVPGGDLATYLDLLSEVGMCSSGAPGPRSRKGKKGKGMPAVPPTLLSEPLIKVLATCVLTTLDVMHGNNVCHGDIKSENVFIDESSGSLRFVLGDMGLAEQADEAGFVSGQAGSYAYAAPEVYKQMVGGVAEGGVTLKSDMASVGMLLAAAAAFHSSPATMRRYMRRECGLPPQTPPLLQDLIEKLVDLSPEARPSAMEALAHPYLLMG